MWNKYLKDARAQIIAGAYETMYYANYVLYKKGLIKTLDYNNVSNMSLINWSAQETDSNFKDTLRRIFACYNGGQYYGMNVDLDKAQNNYPNMVFKYAMEFRSTGLKQDSGNIKGDKSVESVIQAGQQWVGKSPYVWGGGRTESDIKAGRFDCSSFVYYCFNKAGVNLGGIDNAVTFTLVNMGKKINPKDMKRGDVIFFDTYTKNGHVAIYLGNNQFMHDSTSKGVTISEFNSYWKSKFNGNVRRYT